MKTAGIVLFLAMLCGCSTGEKSNHREVSFMQRAPNEVTTSEDKQIAPSGVEKFTPRWEIPKGSRLRREDLTEEKEKCVVKYFEHRSEVTLGVYFKPAMDATLELRPKVPCSETVCQEEADMVDPSGGGYRLIWRYYFTDITRSHFDKLEFEVRDGRKKQATEDMPLQIRFTCEREEYLGS